INLFLYTKSVILITQLLRYIEKNIMNCCFFFFQAEDGIRDFHVTGVQTCALPICKDGKDGERGPKGDRGPQGEQGPPGKDAPSTVYLYDVGSLGEDYICIREGDSYHCTSMNAG